MRLLLDESLSTRIAPLLSQDGHDVVHVADIDLLGEPDNVVLSTAAEQGRTLVTADTDFGALLALSRAAVSERAAPAPQRSARGAARGTDHGGP